MSKFISVLNTIATRILQTAMTLASLFCVFAVWVIFFTDEPGAAAPPPAAVAAAPAPPTLTPTVAANCGAPVQFPAAFQTGAEEIVEGRVFTTTALTRQGAGYTSICTPDIGTHAAEIPSLRALVDLTASNLSLIDVRGAEYTYSKTGVHSAFFVATTVSDSGQTRTHAFKMYLKGTAYTLLRLDFPASNKIEAMSEATNFLDPAWATELKFTVV